MTKVEALRNLMIEHGGIVNWKIIYNQIENFYPEVKRPKDWQAALRGVLYREIYKNRHFKIIENGFITLIDFDEKELDVVEIADKETSKIVTVSARIGQEKFKEKLLKEFHRCPVTKVNDRRVLIASHIKPWSLSNNSERLDERNGFILSPNIDKLFDKGLITFDEKARLIISKDFAASNAKNIGIEEGVSYPELRVSERLMYLRFHQDNIFI